MPSSSEGTFQRREIWFANHSPTEGREQRGDRPTLIVSDGRFNESGAGLVIACPLTTTDRGLASHVHVPAGEGVYKDSYVLCEGVRSMAKSRFREYLGTLPPGRMREVEERLRFLLAL